jgi:succinyl-CoA synthetase beta subunit
MNSIEEKLQEIGKQRRILVETESKGILEQWGIPTVPGVVATSGEEALRLAHSIGFPVVQKILSPDIIHKTEVGGVKLNLTTDQDVHSGFHEIMENAKRNCPSASVLGVTVQKMVSGIEVVIGTTKDPQFGYVLMFGMGGVWVELLEDITFRLIPIDRVDAEEMIRDIKGFPVLKGYRGLRADLESLAGMLMKVSDLIVAYPDIDEMDLNPVITSPAGSVVADARIILMDSSS